VFAALVQNGMNSVNLQISDSYQSWYDFIMNCSMRAGANLQMKGDLNILKDRKSFKNPLKMA